jgi:hypothetical protein
MSLSLVVLLDHIANYLLNDDDKDNLVWFSKGAFLVLALLCGMLVSSKNTVAVVAAAGGGGQGNGVCFCCNALP